MSKINLGRVVLGGLLAGLVLNIGEFLLNDVVMGAQMKAEFERMRLPEPGSSFIVVAVLMTFLLGIVMVWLYALIRSRLNPGPLTAVIAGVILWLGIYVYGGIINGLVLGFTINYILIGIIWGLVEYVIAAIAGAWVYKEA
jgi:hypothetical protein